MRDLRILLSSLFLILITVSCGSVPEREPVPEALVDLAVIPGLERARAWGDEAPARYRRWLERSAEELRKAAPALAGTEHQYLAISGGGSNGAFGAGLLCGWTKRGDRPEFEIVTGVSTGALIAPFAFLGPEYDEELERFYTSVTDADIFELRGTLSGLLSDAVASTAPLRRLIEETVDDEMIAQIAAEHARGRRLLIGTTNLDVSRPVQWDLGYIASSGMPGAKKLIHDVLLASAAIPILFPPVLIQVEANGARYDEIHVDGGVCNQVFFASLDVNLRRILERLDIKGRPQLYIIRNGQARAPYVPIDPPRSRQDRRKHR
jgi:hypothetical protein